MIDPMIDLVHRTIPALTGVTRHAGVWIMPSAAVEQRIETGVPASVSSGPSDALAGM
jgi:hypothetical protein